MDIDTQILSLLRMYLHVGGTSQVSLNPLPDPFTLVRNPLAKAGNIRDSGLIPGLGRSPGGGRGTPLQYYCLGNPMDRGTWWGAVHRVVKSWTE